MLASSSSVTTDRFTHLHLHTVYSLLDGAIRISDLMRHVKAQGMTSVAMTDHGNMFGTVEFYQEAKKHGIKPIIGCEVYVAGGSRFDKRQVDKIADGGNYHLVLLAKNKVGYKNLIKLSSLGYIEGFYKKPRIDYEVLSEYSEGLVALTACLGGEVNRRLLEGRDEDAWKLAGHLNELFGTGNFFLEIQDHNIPEQREVAKGAIALHKRLNIPLVLTNDSHFLTRKDQKAQDIMLRIQMRKTLEDEMMFSFNEEFYVKSSQEMKLLYPEFPDAFHNTALIDDMIDLELDFGHPLLPDFKTPNNMPLYDYLKQESYEGLAKKFEGKSNLLDKYIKRLEYELDVIHKMGYEGYFLIVSDFINFAKKKTIPVGPGRGSAAGSLVAYGLGITNVDPLKYNLLFERFLNPARNEMPDIDIDFCRDRREEVYNYVVEKYGKDYVSQIITFGTLSAKAVIKDVARVLGYSFDDVNTLTKNIPDMPGLTLDDALEQELVRDFFNKGEKERLLLEVAQSLEGVPRNHGKHAAGVVIAPKPLDSLVPLAYDNKTNAVITQFEKNSLEDVGLVKIDFLGLKNLTVIDHCIKNIKLYRDQDVDINNIPLDDTQTYQLLRSGKTKGIFQLENIGITQLLKASKPTCFEDIVACIALYRPGPLQSGMTAEYVKRKLGVAKVEYPHKNLESILKETFGTVIYQEQVMLISQIIGGFSMSEADDLRKAMGKKKHEIVEKLKQKFIDGAEKQQYNKKWATELYDKLGEFASYGFNKSHSVAYGLITHQTAYLKAHFPIEFLKSLLDGDIESTDNLIGFIHECHKMGIKVLSPDVNTSDVFFTIIGDNTLRFGLLGIKGLGGSIAETIVSIRTRNESFISLIDFITKIPAKVLNKKVLEVLICSGALDTFGYSRSSLWNSCEQLLKHSSKSSLDREIGQSSLFGVEEESKNFIISQVEEWSEIESSIHEKEALGLFLTTHPLDKYKTQLDDSSITSLSELDDGVSSERSLKIMGVIEKIKNKSTRSGASVIVVTLSDLTGMQDINVYQPVYQKSYHLLHENSVVIMDVRVAIFRDREVPVMAVSTKGVHSTEELGQYLKRVIYIQLPKWNNSLLKNKIAVLRTIFRKYKGKDPVFLRYYSEDTEDMQTLKLHGSFFISFSWELLKDLTNIVGVENLAYQEGSTIITSNIIREHLDVKK